jgi:uncharacterized protein
MLEIPKILPVFALPTVVFFPKTYLPLHIFEPRYREMVRDAAKGEQIIVVTLLKEGWETEYYAKPEIYTMGCAGKIVKVQALEDGKFNIVLFGLMRVHIKEGLFEKSYRQAWVDPAQPAEPGFQTLQGDLRERLVEYLNEYGKLIGAQQQMEVFLKVQMDDETLVNLFSSELNFTPVEKQFLLEAEVLSQQCKRLMDLIQFKIDEVTRGHATG